MKNRCFVFLCVLLSLLLLFSAPVTAAEETQAASQDALQGASRQTQDDRDAVIAPEESALQLPAPDSERLPEPKLFPFQADFHPQAKSAMLVELQSNAIVYSLNPDARVYPASLTKILTCILALEYTELSDIVTVTDTSLEDLDLSGSSAGLRPGEQMSMENLLYCMMLSSANEACNVAAEHICGDVDKFIELMNAKAAALGCTNTHFSNTHGLHDDNHYTTARDLSIIARYAWQNASFRRITSAVEYTVPATNKSEARELVTTNYLLRKSAPTYYYDKACGIKTGFTTPAGGCLISTATDKNIEFLSIVCGCETVHESDGSYTDERFTVTKKLFQYGFEHYSYAQVVTTLQMTASVPVTLSSGRDSVVVHPAEDVYALLPVDYDTTLVTTSYRLYDDAESLQAPLEAEQPVGELTVYYDGEAIGTAPISTTVAVERSAVAYASVKTRGFLTRYWWIFVLLLAAMILTALMLVSRARRRRRRLSQQIRRRRQQQNRRRLPK